MRNKMNYYSRKIRNIMSKLMIVILIGAMGFGALGCSSQTENAEEAETDEDTVEETEDVGIYGDASLGIDAVVDEELRDYRTILIAGIDNGHRADIQIVLSLNKKTNEARIFTVSRDTYMQIADGDTVTINGREYEFCKCNRAYEVGDKYALMKELNMHLDLNIREFIGVDWDCTRELVDRLGGLKVNIDNASMLDALNSMYGPENQIDGLGETTLNGEQAVQYLRVRKYKGGSARVREERARAVFKQLFDQTKDMTIDEISDVYDDIASMLDTNMSRNTLTETLVAITGTDLDNTENWPYEYTRYWDLDGHFYYFVPDSLISNVKEMHANIFDQQDYLPSMTVQVLQGRIDDMIENHLAKKNPK